MGALLCYPTYLTPEKKFFMAKKIINRELSWLSFNERVLQEAADTNVPLAERIKFLGIFSNNLDEFFKVRVASIKKMIDLGLGEKKQEGGTPKQNLLEIQAKVIKLQGKFQRVYQHILQELEKENIFLIDEKALDNDQKKFVSNFFEDKVLAYLTPVMLNYGDPFPYLKDKSIYLATKMWNVEDDLQPQYALVELPTAVVDRFIVLPEKDGKKFIILLDDVIRFGLQKLFSIFVYDHYEAYTIKLTRDAELTIDNDLSQSFLEKISSGVSMRKKGQPVRFVFDCAMPIDLLDFVKEGLELDNEDNLIPGGRYHNFKDFMAFPFIGKHLEYPSTPPSTHPLLENKRSVIETIQKRDILLHYPYQKFSHFVDLLREAAIDPKVESIAITVYRVAKNSKVINALINAARNGKKVTAVIELQARFDEKSNIYWAQKLEEAGAEIIFGIKGLKVHSKLVLITRKNQNRVEYTAAVSTGNFHEGNANVYTDVTLLTADKRITKEVKKVFEFFVSPYENFSYRSLLASPLYMRKRIYQLIDNEIENAQNGKQAYIYIKINNLIDRDIVKKLYQANNAGVKVKLIVRGICGLQAGIEGISENIEAVSIVDKFLEHARIMIFCNNGDEQYYITSADLMTRNLDHRVEIACPIYDPIIKKELKHIIDLQLHDNVKARIVNQNQDNPFIQNNKPPLRSQMEIYEYYKALGLKKE
jgi:polyphosphate kinase